MTYSEVSVAILLFVLSARTITGAMVRTIMVRNVSAETFLRNYLNFVQLDLGNDRPRSGEIPSVNNDRGVQLQARRHWGRPGRLAISERPGYVRGDAIDRLRRSAHCLFRHSKTLLTSLESENATGFSTSLERSMRQPGERIREH